MYKHHKISVSIPIYNEENFIIPTLEGIPEFIDLIVINDDCSKDNSVKIVKEYQKKDKRIILIENTINKGKGTGLLNCHNKAVEEGCDIIISIDGDNQMDTNYMPVLLDKIIDDGYAYTKGNRFFHVAELRQMPRFRLVGNAFVSLLAKLCTGYWSISDPLNGYTAIKTLTYTELDHSKFAKGFDIEVSILNELALINAKVKDVFIPAKYGEEVSDIRLVGDTLKTTRSLLKGFLRRIFVKYILLNFSPIALFYITGFLLVLWGVIFGLFVTIISLGPKSTTTATVMLSVVPFILGVQLILQAITLDINNEPK